MNFSCPSCRASWTLEERYYRGASPFTCGKCNKTSTIPLYCPQCAPPAVEEKPFLDTPEGFLGGERFRCPRGHTFTVPVSKAETLSRLAGMGAPIGGGYDQTVRIERLADGALKKQVSDGYCAGVVLDWVRRALLGGKTTYADVAPRQDRRAAIAWTEQTKAKKEAFLELELAEINAAQRTSFNARQIEVHQAAETQRDELWADLQKRLQGYAKQNGITQTMYDGLVALAKASYDSQRANVDASAKQQVADAKASVAAASKAKLDRPTMDRFWKEFAGRMDRVLEKDRLDRMKVGPSKRGFSNLVVAKSADSSVFNGGVCALIEAVIRDPAFKPNFAAAVGLRPPREKATGHAIGILRLNTGDRYVLFEPNYGTFEFTAANLRKAVTFLFATAYPHALAAVGTDNQAYEIDGKISGDYTIFENVGASAPTVAPYLPIASAAAAAGGSPVQLSPRAESGGTKR